ncbi:MAG: hypothetical protein E7287_01465 [Lachnospiraceae bacterium]|nr:hypothetical protein [Lachnospiraceae bacterium]
MFGYIIVNKAEMKFKEFDIYHSYYCGLCQSLRKKYGKTGQLSLSYDMTFVLMLLSSLYEPPVTQGKCKCIAHPFEKHEIRTTEITEYIADMNLLLTYYKCQDDWQDEKKFFRMLYGRMVKGKGKHLKEKYAEKIDTIFKLMCAFSEAEESGKADIDELSGLFGQVMAQIMVYKEDEWTDNLGRLGFYLGKFIYLLDAYEDVEDDIRKNTFNPLKAMYQRADFEEECRTILTIMMSECCKEFEKLPILDNVEILRNILYSGVWTRYELVREKRKGKE